MMARPSKIGLDFFPMDVDFFQDIKIRKLVRSQGGKAIAVYALLLCNIYKNGYYVRWDEELPFIISESTGYEEVYIREVIRYCLSIDLLSKDMYEKEGVLTSKGIQERYKVICSRRNMPVSEYSLIGTPEAVSAAKTPVIAAITPVSVAKTPVSAAISSTERKGNKSKKEKKPTDVGKKESAMDAAFLPEAFASGTHRPAVPFSEIVEMWNTECLSYPRLTGMGEARQNKVRVRYAEMGGEAAGLDTLREVFRRMQESRFLQGDNNRGWRATFDWVMQNDKNWRKILEGNYDNSRQEPLQKPVQESVYEQNARLKAEYMKRIAEANEQK